MIDINEVLVIYEILIEEFGGIKGVRDRNLLESSIHRPFSTFDGQDLYKTPIDKAAALLESIVVNHPFLDGNKRTGYTLMRLTLLQFNMDIDASQDNKYELVIGVAEGPITFDQIKRWIEKNLNKQ